MKRRTGSILLASAMLTGVLAGCSSNNSGNNGGNAASGSPSASASGSSSPSASQTSGQSGSGEKVTIQFWHSTSGKTGEALDAMVQRFNSSHPDVQVVSTFQGSYDDASTKLQQAIAGNNAPDVSMVERAYVQQFAESDVLADMTPYMDKSGMSKDDFVQGLMGHSVFNDKLVSLPLNRSTPIFYINKKMLDEKGLQVPQTWDDLKKVANALVVKENGKVSTYGLTMPYDTWYPLAMITQAGSTFFSDDGKTVPFVDDGTGNKVFSYLRDLQDSGALYYPPSQDSGSIVNQMFTSGKVGMVFQSTGIMSTLQTDFDYVTAFLPADKQHAEPTGGGNIVMLDSSKHKDAAWEFVQWVETDPQGAQQFILDTGYLPFTKKMAESQEVQDLWAKDPNRKTAYDQLQYAVDTNKSVAWPLVMKEFFSAIEAIMYDHKDVDATLKTFKKSAEDILSSN
ncbi:ABC transporter substrate-binding protein [Cohnella zeiphila]|uniref:ABC transporter substrate-binding protein n=1 Tax=Cohnella zeiphila TaxID=2761120 RepID=A0A7X0VV42_9BACL|nr:ABC transporter substrate-binding protein [Cohnella zeiphila]MBB6731556.1 ABC transporter substrate-binding protein [Cohnella zeiphila]